VSGGTTDIAHELLAQSLVAWRVAGRIERSSEGAIIICGALTDIRIDRAPSNLMFRWTVTIDGRTRGAISLLSVLRQVRGAIEPGYAAGRVRIAVSALTPS
jgi:hypothetical protein